MKIKCKRILLCKTKLWDKLWTSNLGIRVSENPNVQRSPG